jgi:hypothetical protein
MLTATYPDATNPVDSVAPSVDALPREEVFSRDNLASDALPSDQEISLRVLRIRSRWSPSERLRRRQMAEQRFADLLSALVIGEAA